MLLRGWWIPRATGIKPKGTLGNLWQHPHLFRYRNNREATSMEMCHTNPALNTWPWLGEFAPSTSRLATPLITFLFFTNISGTRGGCMRCRYQHVSLLCMAWVAGAWRQRLPVGQFPSLSLLHSLWRWAKRTECAPVFLRMLVSN